MDVASVAGGQGRNHFRGVGELDVLEVDARLAKVAAIERDERRRVHGRALRGHPHVRRRDGRGGRRRRRGGRSAGWAAAGGAVTGPVPARGAQPASSSTARTMPGMRGSRAACFPPLIGRAGPGRRPGVASGRPRGRRRLSTLYLAPSEGRWRLDARLGSAGQGKRRGPGRHGRHSRPARRAVSACRLAPCRDRRCGPARRRSARRVGRRPRRGRGPTQDAGRVSRGVAPGAGCRGR